MQKCLAQLEFPKVGYNEDLFGSYVIEYGARIYKNYTETDFVQIPEATATQIFEAPVYSDQSIIEHVSATSITHESVFIEESYEFNMSDAIPGTTGKGHQYVRGTLHINPDPTAEQRIEIQMSTSIPNEYAQNMDGKVVMNDISFTNLEDWKADPAKVTCRTTIGNEYNGEVKQYDKDTDLKSMSARGDTTKELSKD